MTVDQMLAFWGKARPSAESQPRWHPVAFHCLDVAAVANALMRRRVGADIERIAQHCGWSAEALIRMGTVLVGLHDIGKFSRPFQAKVLAHWPAFLDRPGDFVQKPHDEVGLALLVEDWPSLAVAALFPKWNNSHFMPLLRAVAGHHGRPAVEPETTGIDLRVACARCREAAALFVRMLMELLEPCALAPPPRGVAATLGWWLAGLTTLSDWIGSSQDWFAYESPAVTPHEYWRLAQMRAAKAVRQTGLIQARSRPVRPALELLPGVEALTPLQRLAETIELGDVSCLVLEDSTGSGKTEAALILAHRLIAAGRADGLFFALPTMATADGMFGRLRASYRKLFEQNADPSLALAHGRAQLNEGFTDSIRLPLMEFSSREPEASDAEEPVSSQCAAWLADERRRVFLADVGVGTIDQALLAVLPSRHAALRLFALSRKILIIDEAHAFDDYMNAELDRLLQFHAVLGGCSIVLSATLPRNRRGELVRAHLAGLGRSVEVPMQDEYPLLTLAGAGGIASHAVPIERDASRVVRMTMLDEPSDAVARLVAAANAGACAIWIRNTVQDSRDAAEMLSSAGHQPILFHAGFAMGDRLRIQDEALSVFGKGGLQDPTRRAPGGLGRLLVATQVVEQSLDLDADLMVSDLAPIECLIQRAGRLQRHAQYRRPVGFERAELFVVSPSPVDTPGPAWAACPSIGGSRFVYPPHVLWRTARIIERAGEIRSPGGIRGLIEGVYGSEQEAVPASLLAAEVKATGVSMARLSHARGNLLDPVLGYCRQNGDWSPEHRTPTRDADDGKLFRLARIEEGRLIPYWSHPDPRKAWALSEISLRAAVADGEPDADACSEARRRARANWTRWEAEMPVLVLEPEPDGCFRTRAVRHDAVRTLRYWPRMGLSAEVTSG